jgi:glucan biosynthesis protein C
MHLWFLWYLFLLCLGVWGLLLALRRLPPRWRERLAGGLESVATSRFSFLVGVLLTALTLRTMNTAAIATGTSLWPRWSILLAYFVFFAFGWVWYRRSDYLATLRKGWLGRLILGSLLGVACTILNFGTLVARTRPSAALLLVTAAACWWIIIGLLGLFQRHFSRPWPLSRYLADASYWVYLVHLPVLIALALALRAWFAPIGVKYLTLVCLAFAVCLATCHLFVRSTFVGAFLNGRRRPA